MALIEAGALAAEAGAAIAWSDDPPLVAAAAGPVTAFLMEYTSAVDLHARSLAVSGQLAAPWTAAATNSDETLQGAEAFTAAARGRYAIITATLGAPGYTRIQPAVPAVAVTGRQLWILRTILLSLTVPGESGPGLEWDRIVADARGYAGSGPARPDPAEYDELFRLACSGDPADRRPAPPPDTPGYDPDTVAAGVTWDRQMDMAMGAVRRVAQDYRDRDGEADRDHTGADAAPADAGSAGGAEGGSR